VTVPVSLQQVMDVWKYHKSPLSAVFSNLGFPVSKGYPGGEFGQKIDDFKAKQYRDKKEGLKDVDELIKDGKVVEAEVRMWRDLGMREVAISHRLLKFRDPLLSKWATMSKADQMMYLAGLSEDQRRKFIEALTKGTSNDRR